MSNEELAAAKAKLLPRLRELGDKRSAFFDVLNQGLVKAIQLGLSFALTGVLLWRLAIVVDAESDLAGRLASHSAVCRAVGADFLSRVTRMVNRR